MIYIATHKKFSPPLFPEYYPLLVGAEKNRILEYSGDNTGENISNKNKNFCELTGVYWIWKNVNDNYKGLVHYRRYFSCGFGSKKIIREDEVKKILKKYDVILPFRKKLSTSVKEQYCNKSGFEKDLKHVENAIKALYPEYLETFCSVIEGNETYFYNMLISSQEIFDGYCEWLFNILFEVEKHVDLLGYNDYQKRIFGFLSERLLTVYFKYNTYSIYECGIVPGENEWTLKKRILTGLKRRVTHIGQMYLNIRRV